MAACLGGHAAMNEPPAKIDWWNAFLTISVGVTLTYFFYEPISSGVSEFVGSLLPSGW
jgi:hypothetical protein